MGLDNTQGKCDENRSGITHSAENNSVSVQESSGGTWEGSGTLPAWNFRYPFLLFLVIAGISLFLAWINRNSFRQDYFEISFSTVAMPEETKKLLKDCRIICRVPERRQTPNVLVFGFHPQVDHYSHRLPGNVNKLHLVLNFKEPPRKVPVLQDFKLWGKRYTPAELRKLCNAEHLAGKKVLIYEFPASSFTVPKWNIAWGQLLTAAFCLILLFYGIWWLLLRRNAGNEPRFMEKKALTFFFIIAVFTLMILPVCYMSNEVIDPIEKRFLSKFPDPSRLVFRNFSNFCKEWERAFEDRFYGRIHLITLKKFIFRGNDDPNVLIGKKDYLFLKDTLYNPWNNFANTTIYPYTEMVIMGEIFNKLHKFAVKRGKVFLFLMAPDKCRIYGEYVPMNKAHPDKYSGAETLANFLRTHYRFPSIFTRQHLLNRKKLEPSIPLYQHEDTHWTDYGAYYGCYLPVIEYLNSRGYKIPVYKPQWALKQERRGDLSWMIGYEKRKYSYLMDNGPIHYNLKINNYRQDSIMGDSWLHNAKGAPLKVVFYRDSYMEKGKHFFGQTFRDVTLFWRTPQKKDLPELESADIIIYESVERFAGSYLLNKLSYPWEDK